MLLLTLLLTTRLPAHRVGGGPDRLWAQEDTAHGAAGRCSRRVGGKAGWARVGTGSWRSPPRRWGQALLEGDAVTLLVPNAGFHQSSPWPPARTGTPGMAGLRTGPAHVASPDQVMRDLECHGPCLTMLAVREVGRRGTRNKLSLAGGMAWVVRGFQVDPSPLSGPLRGQGG